MYDEKYPLPSATDAREQTEIRSAFLGYDRSPAVLWGTKRRGALTDMQNMTIDTYPYPSLRPKRYTVATFAEETLSGLGVKEKSYYVIEDAFYYDGVLRGKLNASHKRRFFVNFDQYVLIFPDHAYYDTEKELFGRMDLIPNMDWSEAYFGNGTLDGESVGMNTLYSEDAFFDAVGFRAGDGVIISYVNGTKTGEVCGVVREVTYNQMRFDAKTFRGLKNATVTEVARKVPAFTHAFRCGNRLWGCVGNKIYASVAGNPFNFFVYDGQVNDAWESATDRIGDFRAACAFRDNPTFFCDNAIVRVLGFSPNGFQLSVTDGVAGVAENCADSLCGIGTVLYYCAADGIMAYNGTTPKRISEPLGLQTDARPPIDFCAGGSDGRHYFCSLHRRDGSTDLYVYDTERSLFAREDDLYAMQFVRKDGILYAACTDRIVTVGNVHTPKANWEAEQTVTGEVQLSDFCREDMATMVPHTCALLLPHAAQTSFRFLFSFDGGTAEELPASCIEKNGEKYRLTLPAHACTRSTLRIVADGSFCLCNVIFSYRLGEKRVL